MGWLAQAIIMQVFLLEIWHQLRMPFELLTPGPLPHQGIEKMRLLHKLGLKQAVLPPHQRPNLHLLHQLGFKGSAISQVQQAMRTDPHLLSACYSASSMWAANTATVSASNDTKDGHVHFTAANLVSNLHRQQEAAFSSELLQTLFSDPRFFTHHPFLPNSATTSDEGAANHTRLCQNHSAVGVNLFVYGKQALPAGNNHPAPIRYPARQTLEASQANARNHLLRPENVVYAYQNPFVIDKGVFHNDVISVGNESLLLLHTETFLHQEKVLTELNNKAQFPLSIIEVQAEQFSVEDAVNSYLFNSQLVTLPNQTMALILPLECAEHPQIKEFVDQLLKDATNPIEEAHYLNLKQSMLNGGGPACLRLRVPLNERELAAMHQGVLVTDVLLDLLDRWVDTHYRTQLSAKELADPELIDDCFVALDELTSLLDLGSIYPFQREASC